MNPMPMETEYVREELAHCLTTGELKKKILPMLQSQQGQWGRYIQALIPRSGHTKSSFAAACGVSRVAIDKWCKGSIPKSRETFLRIGLAANLTEEEMNRLLQRYGQYPGLYSKSLEDCICMFVLRHNEGRDALNQFEYIRNRITEKLIPGQENEGQNITTVKFDKLLMDVGSQDVLENFIAENISVFSYSYHKFYAYVKMNLEVENGGVGSVNEMAIAQGWTSSLRQCVSAIRQNKWYPTRNKIISLGLHLCMDREQVDQMLEFAHMEPLYPKNIFESVILFILENGLECEELYDKDGYFDSDGLCLYAKKVLGELKMPEFDWFLAEVSDVDDEDEG